MTATESPAAAELDLDSPAFGPQPPARADLYAAQDAPLEAGLSDAEFDRRLTGRIQTEIACKEASDRERVRVLEAESADPGPWAEGNYGPFADPLPPDLADSMASWPTRSASAPEPEPEIEP